MTAQQGVRRSLVDAETYRLAASEMLTGSIAESVSRTLDLGEVTLRGSGNDVISIHIQCPYRILVDGVPVLGSADVRFCVFDARAKTLTGIFAKLKPKVLEVELGEAGAFTAKMSGGVALEVFPDCSGRVEAWRIFSRDRPGSWGYPPDAL
jgi:hypothetical protein